MSEHMEGGRAPLVAAHHLLVDEAGPHLKMVHGLDHERKAAPTNRCRAG
jgi:hypothetical protein